MTTKPKARKFRIRRAGAAETSAVATEPVAPQEEAVSPEAVLEQEAPLGGMVSSAAEARVDEEIDAIRKEGLTGRQLRLARRVAQQHKIAATSDFDAVRLLRAQGIDPFQRSNMLELVVPGGSKKGAAEPGLPQKRAPEALPQTMKVETAKVPSTELADPAVRRAREIQKVQRDLARRRQKKLALLLTRLFFFVALPTIALGYYFYVIATPMYSTKSEFLVLKADGVAAGALSAGAGMMGSSPLATVQDSVALQSYLQSKEAMLRLDADVGFREHFSQDWIDPLQRLAPDASDDVAYKLYKRNIEIGYDPTEGIIKMEIFAADPEESTVFSKALLTYAEERIDNLSKKKRDDRLSGAQEALEDSRNERQKAQAQLLRLQAENQLVDAEAQIGALRSQISRYEGELEDKKLELKGLNDNRRPNQAKVAGLEREIGNIEALLVNLRARATDSVNGENSLASLATQLKLAEADLQSRDLMLQEAITELRATRREADAQVRYLTTSVSPLVPTDPTYPRKFENTLLSFLIFAGLYLVLSITVSVLREQVSS